MLFPRTSDAAHPSAVKLLRFSDAECQSYTDSDNYDACNQ
jgi:hypothetical protein